jgi:hypothetical protein
MYSVPLFFRLVDNASATVAGAHLFPAIAGVTVAGLAGGFAIKRCVAIFTLKSVPCSDKLDSVATNGYSS